MNGSLPIRRCAAKQQRAAGRLRKASAAVAADGEEAPAAQERRRPSRRRAGEGARSAVTWLVGAIRVLSYGAGGPWASGTGNRVGLA